MKLRPDLRTLLDVPIMQAPTGSIAGPELCAAVSEAGGIGGMGLTWTPPELAVAAVKQVLTKTDRPFLVNFALAFPPASLPAVLQAGAPIISFSWGDAGPYIQQVHTAGALCGIQVTSAEGARYAASIKADFIICQGIEAGGHVQSSTPLAYLLPQVLAAASGMPVVASGGIGNAQQARQFLGAGAAAVMMGTRFVATQESRAHPLYRELLVQSRASDTALTVCFDGGWQGAIHRVLRNNTLSAWEAVGSPPAGLRPGEGEILGFNAAGEEIERYSDAAPRSGFRGDVAAMCLYAGCSVEHINTIPTVAELMAQLRCELIRNEEHQA